MPEAILALDLGSTTGWATWSPSAGVQSGVLRLDRLVDRADKDHPGALLDVFGRRIMGLASEPYPITVLAFEEVYHDTRGRGWKAARLLLGWRAIALAIAYRLNARTHPVEPTTLKMATLGWVQRKDLHNRKVFATGEHVLQRVRAFVPDVGTEHEAVALGVLDVTMRDLRLGVPPLHRLRARSEAAAKARRVLQQPA